MSPEFATPFSLLPVEAVSALDIDGYNALTEELAGHVSRFNAEVSAAYGDSFDYRAGADVEAAWREKIGILWTNNMKGWFNHGGGLVYDINTSPQPAAVHLRFLKAQDPQFFEACAVHVAQEDDSTREAMYRLNNGESVSQAESDARTVQVWMTGLYVTEAFNRMLANGASEEELRTLCR